MIPSLLVFVLVGRVAGVRKQCPSYVKISGANVSPSGPVESGGEVTIRCFANSFNGFGLFVQQTDKRVSGRNLRASYNEVSIQRINNASNKKTITLSLLITRIKFLI
ncbi:hypothetical protein DICVIV_05698 [Dictyocaulus viviparus]|uniref:Immunoglobulin subtype domain-containing protein n=1 Tax=Dictyocaulus viviparus TaxID=29172 RepID=A0A0D8XUK7_DICVI|nr:hypothetical protein DICVIV_05698 [Dictyocaulus viviparus]